MTRLLQRLGSVVLLAAWAFVLPVAAIPGQHHVALAQEEGEAPVEEGEVGEVEVLDEDAEQLRGPVVVIPDEGEGAADADWTFRYLVPTAIVASALIVGLVIILYVLRVRGRYRVEA